MERTKRQVKIQYIPGLMGLEHRQLLTTITTPPHPLPLPIPLTGSEIAPTAPNSNSMSDPLAITGDDNLKSATGKIMAGATQGPWESTITGLLVDVLPEIDQPTAIHRSLAQHSQPMGSAASASASVSASAPPTTRVTPPRPNTPAAPTGRAISRTGSVTVTPPRTANPTITPATNTGTAAQSFRIDRLPQYLRSLDPERVIPEDLLVRMQDGLRAMEGQFTHRAAPQTLDLINDQLGDVLTSQSLRFEDAVDLNQTVGQILSSAGAGPQLVVNLQNDLLELNRISSSRPQPARLMANDYAIVVQLALGIGRPLTGYPRGPAIASVQWA